MKEHLTSRSYGEGLETDRASAEALRRSLTRQLGLRNIKTTLGIEVLRCQQTPPMIHKELWLHPLA